MVWVKAAKKFSLTNSGDGKCSDLLTRSLVRSIAETEDGMTQLHLCIVWKSHRNKLRSVWE